MSDLALFNNGTGTVNTLSTGTVNTLSTDNVQNKNRALRALNMAESLAQVVRPDLDTFEVVDIIQTPGTRRSRVEGVPDAPCVNTYFLLADGRALMSQSGGIATSAQMLLAAYPSWPEDLPDGSLTLMVHEQKLSNGNTRKSVFPID